MSDQADTAQLTAAPAEVTIGGETFRMSPLTDRDEGELDNWLRTRLINIARDSLGLGATARDEQITMDAAFRVAASTSWIRDGHKHMAHVEGVSRFLWQTLRKEHPKLSLDHLTDLIRQDSSAIRRAMDTFDLLNRTNANGEAEKKGAPTEATD